MINTVRGKINVEWLGITYIHEHLYVVPNDLPKYEDYTLDDLGKSIEEVGYFRKAGGKSLVDLTPVGYGRNPIALEYIAKQTGCNIMFVTGFHKEEFQPRWLDELSQSEIYDFLIHEITEGVTSHHLLPAAMKIGTSFKQITDREKRIIEVAGRVQRDTKVPIISHCDHGTMGPEQFNILKENGADLAKVCLSHVDLTKNLKDIKKVCERGAAVSFDHVGRELSNNDMECVQLLSELVKSGFGDHICLAGDMGRKKYFRAYGGKPGLDYILTNLKDKLLQEITLKDYNKMLIDNPQRILE